MASWKSAATAFFLAAASVYPDHASAGGLAGRDENTGSVKLLNETDAPTTAPTESTEAASAPMTMNADGTFSLNVTAGADVVETLRIISFQAQESIIPSAQVHGTLPAMDLYNVTVHEALDAVLHANGYAWREKGKFIYVYSEKEIAEQEKAARQTSTEVFRLYYTPAVNAVTMLKPVLSTEAQVSSTTAAKGGLGTGTSDTGGDDHAVEDIIVVTDYPENLDKVRQILKEVDRRPQQILVEATILSARLRDENKLGVDFNIVGGVDFSTLTTSNGQINTADSAAVSRGTNNVSSVGTGNNFSNIGNAFKVGLVTNNVSLFVSALEGVTDTAVLANPKVLALNKQKGEVIVGNETGYITTTTTETTTSQTVEFLKTGTRLVFRPFIGDDGYIRMEIHPEDSSGGLQTAANLPYKSTTEVTTNIMVKDGRTIVIGGLFRDDNSSTRSQVPVLGNLPGVGALFRQQADTSVREEIIILLTPHIVKDDNAMSEMAEAAMKDAERLRVGVRKGMMFWSRQRLADMYYQWAVDEMNKPRPDRQKALWNLNAATNLNPQLLEAIRLKEQLTGQEITASDASGIHSFVRQAILLDRETPTTQPSSIRLPEAPMISAATQPTTEPATAVNDLRIDPSDVVATAEGK